MVNFQRPIGNTIFYYYLCRSVPKRIEIFPIGSRMRLPPDHPRIRPACEILKKEIPDSDKIAQWDVTMLMSSREQFFEPWLYQRCNVSDTHHFWLEETDFYTWDMLKAFGVFYSRQEDVEFAYGWNKPGWPRARRDYDDGI